MQQKYTMSYSGIRILTTSPGAWPEQPLVFAVGSGGGTVRKVALRCLQDHLPLAWNLLGNTSVLSVGRGVEAVGSEKLFTSDESKEPPDEDTSIRDWGGLHNHIRR